MELPLRFGQVDREVPGDSTFRYGVDGDQRCHWESQCVRERDREEVTLGGFPEEWRVQRN